MTTTKKAAEQHLLADDLAELVHIFKENVVVRHSPTPVGEKLSTPHPPTKRKRNASQTSIYGPKRSATGRRQTVSGITDKTPLVSPAAG